MTYSNNLTQLLSVLDDDATANELRAIYSVSTHSRRVKMRAYVCDQLATDSDDYVAKKIQTATGKTGLAGAVAHLAMDTLVPLMLYRPKVNDLYSNFCKSVGHLIAADRNIVESYRVINDAIVAKLNEPQGATMAYTPEQYLNTANNYLGDATSNGSVKEMLIELTQTGLDVWDNAEIQSAIAQVETGLWGIDTQPEQPNAIDPNLEFAMRQSIDTHDSLAKWRSSPKQPAASSSVFSMPTDKGIVLGINSMLSAANTGTTLEEIHSALVSTADELKKAQSKPSGVTITVGGETSISSSTDELPDGKFSVVPVKDRFDIRAGVTIFDFDVPSFEWESPHPHVPAIDPHYIFEPTALLRVLYSIVCNTRCWLHGHTGTGKSTMIEQVCARLGYPLRRVNFDSEITRLDLIGRDVLTQENGTTVSRFEEGILPQAMQEPCVLLCDEMDFVRPDVAYVAQRVLEADGGLMLTEDAGRVIRPNKLFRIFATANTKGQGDEFGMYQGARVQSMAFLERFTSWVKIDYMQGDDRKRLIQSKVPSIGDNALMKINQYIGEHIEAFTGSQVMQPISPRGYLELASAYTFLSGNSHSDERALHDALGMVILDRATEQDRLVLEGISQRVFGNP